MKKALLVLTFLVGMAGGHLVFLLTNSDGQLQRCEDSFLDNPDSADLANNPEIKKQMAKEGFNSFKDMVDDRCKFWIKNGQRF